MRFLIVLAVVGSAVGAPGGSFRYDNVQPFQYNYKQQQGSNFAYGYQYPGQNHHVTKDEYGVVKGLFGYVDANGVPVLWQYMSDPQAGFNAQVDSAPVAPQEETPGAGVSEDQVPASFSPLLKLAIDTGVVQSVGGGQSGVAQFAVSPHLAEELGGVSNLAYRLGAVPVAARHDAAQVRPNFKVSESAFAPVLLHHHETPEITLYSLDVPTE